ncbi:PHP domain-containing protein [candidate division KSB1 bacterium]|nr:PHP domain-containing protein [candidate division KSB1 bacterium]
MKADLHLHSCFSPDAISRPDSILSAAADHGIGWVAITDHNTAAGWRAFTGIAHRYPVGVIFGQEVQVYKDGRIAGELLCLFLSRPVKGRSVSKVLAEVRAQKGLVSIAHPFSERRHEFRAYDQIDSWQDLAFEVRNGRSYNNQENRMAEEMANRLDTPITAGSDAHTPFEIGTVYVEFSGKSAGDLLQAIRSRDVQVGGKPSSMFFTVISGLGRLGLSL